MTGQPPPGYFDNAPPHIRERSTVGSASATGSVGGRTTWASGSVDNDADKMSEGDDEMSSATGLSEEGNGSLVGFGEGASSTISGPVSTPTVRGAARQGGGLASPTLPKASALPSYLQHPAGSPMSGLPPGSPMSANSTATNATEQIHDARMKDGMTYDPDDTSARPLRAAHGRDASATGAEIAEQIMRETIDQPQGGGGGNSGIGGGEQGEGQGLGRFSFEGK